jgi:hypothetical protein
MLMDSTPQSKDIDWQARLKKEDLKISCLQEIHFTERNKHWLRVKG